MVALAVSPQSGEPIADYRLEIGDGAGIFGEELIPVSEEFRYLPLLAGDLSQLQAVFYDQSGQLLYRGNFVAATASISVEEE